MPKNPNLNSLTSFLHRYSAIFFTVFFALALWAFWTSYYGLKDVPIPGYIHFHGISMTLWCVLLISQATLIRFRQFKLHRWSGRLSFVLVPLILASGFHIAHITIKAVPPTMNVYYYLSALMFNSLFAFAILYGLAIRYRKKPATHARYMVCTVFPLVTPVTDRIIYKYTSSLVPHAPSPDGITMVPAFGFALALVLVIAMLIWDWSKHKRLDVFPVVFGLLVLYHISVLTFYRFPFWQEFTKWMMGLPLS